MIAMGTLFQIILTIAIVAHHSQHINQHQKVRSCCSALFSSHQTKRKCINFYVNVHRMWQSFHFRTINSTKNPTARNAHFDENVYLHVFVWNASLCPVFFFILSHKWTFYSNRGQENKWTKFRWLSSLLSFFQSQMRDSRIQIRGRSEWS